MFLSRLLSSVSSVMRSRGLRLLRILVVIIAVAVSINVLMAPLLYQSPQKSPSFLQGENGSILQIGGRHYQVIQRNRALDLSGSGSLSHHITTSHNQLLHLHPNTTKTDTLNVNEAAAVLSKQLPDMRLHLVSMERDSRSEQRHYYRFEKTMISDMNNTALKKPWGKGPNLVNIRPLAKASVIIAFHDHEQLSLILHTVHSIIQRTPKSLLREIILIDDNTEKDDLQQILLNYIKSVFDPDVVRLYRSRQPLGLIKARNLGAQIARGDVIVCMDSHMEVQPKWLERLLYEIYLNPKTLATSHLDWFEYVESEKRWRYTIGGRNWITYFDWQFGFGFQGPDPTQDKLLKKDPTRPVESPVTVGTIWAINRQFFFDIGAFDEKMQKWGGENLDLPIRVWLFGGRVVNVPCSAAGHYEGGGYRDYRKGWEPYFYHNYKRIAEVWFGEYKDLVYYHQPKIGAAVIGDVKDREALTHKTSRDISWFLDNVYPQLVVPERDSFAWGQAQNLGTKMCLETMGGTIPEMYPCGNNDKPTKQNFMWNKNGELRFSVNLIDIQGAPGYYKLTNEPYIPKTDLPTNAQWIHWKGGPIMEWKKKICLETSANNTRQILLSRCDLRSAYQQWEFLNYTSAYFDLALPLDQPQNLTTTQLRMRSLVSLIMAGDEEGVVQFLLPMGNPIQITNRSHPVTTTTSSNAISR